MGLQDATADNSKEEYKEFTDYYSMLRSLVYPKLTTDFKKVLLLFTSNLFQYLAMM